jgi:predicted metal-dependent HD superfamily phosphohydrolase
MKDRWLRVWSELGVDPPSAATFDALRASYSAPDRHYHDLRHVADCLEKFDACRQEAERPAEIEMAIFFHDAIYDTHTADNELKSAEWARGALLEQDVAEPVARRVFDLILATAHAREPAEGDPSLLCDIDLSILGESPETFREYDRRIAAEYAWVPAEIYRQKRGEVLAGFLARPRIYRTAGFFERYEEAARRNLAERIESLAAGSS